MRTPPARVCQNPAFNSHSPLDVTIGAVKTMGFDLSAVCFTRPAILSLPRELGKKRTPNVLL
jgi:hypothetical protein